MPNGGIQGIACTQLLYQLIATTPEIFAMLPTSRLDETLRHVFHDGLLAAPHNGARIMTSREDSATDELIMAAVNAGAEVRTHATLPAWFAIVGRKTVVVPRDPDNADAGLAFLHRGGHVRAALWMFVHAWQTASPFTQENDAFSLNRWERQVLEQLARGIKDEAAARRLGVSVRTYRRHVADLCERLGASSRFEAGIRAAQAGLVLRDRHHDLAAGVGPGMSSPALMSAVRVSRFLAVGEEHPRRERGRQQSLRGAVAPIGAGAGLVSQRADSRSRPADLEEPWAR
jgi:DNA-binding CsgD family transcriptional regulator